MTTLTNVMPLVRAICARDTSVAQQLSATDPGLALGRATSDIFLDEIGHYLYGGDTALHIAAAAYQYEIARALVAVGADVGAKNRRGAEPLHYAADGAPGSPSWNPDAQALTIAYLIEAGADPNALDKSGVRPLHRAVRCRCADAVRALLDGGADPHSRNGSGSTALDLAMRATGRGGSGTAESKEQQNTIVRLLKQRD